MESQCHRQRAHGRGPVDPRVHVRVHDSTRAVADDGAIDADCGRTRRDGDLRGFDLGAVVGRLADLRAAGRRDLDHFSQPIQTAGVAAAPRPDPQRCLPAASASRRRGCSTLSRATRAGCFELRQQRRCARPLPAVCSCDRSRRRRSSTTSRRQGLVVDHLAQPQRSLATRYDGHGHDAVAGRQLLGAGGESVRFSQGHTTRLELRD